MNVDNSFCAEDLPDRSIKSISFTEIEKVGLDYRLLRIQTRAGDALDFDLNKGPLQLRGRVEDGAVFLDLEFNAPPLEGPIHLHYVALNPLFQGREFSLDRFLPAGSEGKANAFGLSVIGIGISDIDDITDDEDMPARASKQTVTEVFKLLEVQGKQAFPCRIELIASESFPDALQLRLEPPVDKEFPRYYLSARMDM